MHAMEFERCSRVIIMCVFTNTTRVEAAFTRRYIARKLLVPFLTLLNGRYQVFVQI